MVYTKWTMRPKFLARLLLVNLILFSLTFFYQDGSLVWVFLFTYALSLVIEIWAIVIFFRSDRERMLALIGILLTGASILLFFSYGQTLGFILQANYAIFAIRGLFRISKKPSAEVLSDNSLVGTPPLKANKTGTPIGVFISLVLLGVSWFSPQIAFLFNPDFAYLFAFIVWTSPALIISVFLILNSFCLFFLRKNAGLTRGVRWGFLFVFIPIIFFSIFYYNLYKNFAEIQKQDNSALLLSNKAIENNDSSFCSQIVDRPGSVGQAGCYNSLAFKNTDLVLCDKVNGENDYGFNPESCRDGVYIQKARDQNDISYCRFIVREDLKDTCIYQLENSSFSPELVKPNEATSFLLKPVTLGDFNPILHSFSSSYDGIIDTDTEGYQYKIVALYQTYQYQDKKSQNRFNLSVLEFDSAQKAQNYVQAFYGEKGGGTTSPDLESVYEITADFPSIDLYKAAWIRDALVFAVSGNKNESRLKDFLKSSYYYYTSKSSVDSVVDKSESTPIINSTKSPINQPQTITPQTHSTRTVPVVLSPNGGDLVSLSSATFSIHFEAVYGKPHYINLIDESNGTGYDLLFAAGKNGPVIGDTDKVFLSVDPKKLSQFDIAAGNLFKIEICSMYGCDKSDSYFKISP